MVARHVGHPLPFGMPPDACIALRQRRRCSAQNLEK